MARRGSISTVEAAALLAVHDVGEAAKDTKSFSSSRRGSVELLTAQRRGSIGLDNTISFTNMPVRGGSRVPQRRGSIGPHGAGRRGSIDALPGSSLFLKTGGEGPDAGRHNSYNKLSARRNSIGLEKKRRNSLTGSSLPHSTGEVQVAAVAMLGLGQISNENESGPFSEDSLKIKKKEFAKKEELPSEDVQDVRPALNPSQNERSLEEVLADNGKMHENKRRRRCASPFFCHDTGLLLHSP
jgi:hypothetical protein